jgi:hypothetical protein
MLHLPNVCQKQSSAVVNRRSTSTMNWGFVVPYQSCVKGSVCSGYIVPDSLCLSSETAGELSFLSGVGYASSFGRFITRKLHWLKSHLELYHAVLQC